MPDRVAGRSPVELRNHKHVWGAESWGVGVEIMWRRKDNVVAIASAPCCFFLPFSLRYPLPSTCFQALKFRSNLMSFVLRTRMSDKVNLHVACKHQAQMSPGDQCTCSPLAPSLGPLPDTRSLSSQGPWFCFSRAGLQHQSVQQSNPPTHTYQWLQEITVCC